MIGTWVESLPVVDQYLKTWVESLPVVDQYLGTWVERLPAVDQYLVLPLLSLASETPRVDYG